MEIIVTHDNADFDALASLVAARRLYPAATMVLGRGGNPELRSFLALHRDRFPTVHATELDLAAVCLLVLVDVRRRSRLKALAPLLARIERGDPSLAVHIYDHHPAAEDDLHGAVEVVAPVGSATTLLVEQVRTRGLDVDPLEATLLALGIHADTGSLTYASTTARDAAAVAWLLERGAVLAVLNRYLHAGFTPEQRRILQRALGTARTERIGGADIAIAVVWGAIPAVSTW